MPSVRRDGTAGGGEERLRALAELGRLVIAGPESAVVLDAAVAAVARLLDVEQVGFWMHDSAAGVLRPAAQVSAGGPAADAAEPIDAALADPVLHAGHSFETDDVDACPLWSRLAASAERPASALCVPVRDRERPLGALVAAGDPTRSFDEQEIQFVEAVATQVAVAIRQARLIEDVERQTRQLAAIVDVNRRLALGPELEEVLSRITEEAAHLLDAEAAALRLVQDDQLVRIARFGFSEPPMGPEQLALDDSPISRTIVDQQRPIVSDDFPNDPRFDAALRAGARAHGLTSWLGVPLRGRADVLGVLSVLGRGARRFDRADVRLLEAFAAQAAIAIENARLYEQAATAEALRELARLKSEFLSTVSHELRTPLSLIHGYSELLVDRAPDLQPDRVAEMAGEIQAGSHTMIRLVDDLLDFSRIEQGRLVLERRPVAVETVLGPLVETFRRQPGGTRIVLEIAANPVARVDPERLAQAVGHLLGNALRYAPEGPIVVRVAASDRELRVEVRDHGPGIAADEQVRVWERFYRGAAARESGTRGGGLGLAAVRHLVELHGGRVGLASIPDRETTFWFVLPLDPSDAESGD